PWDREFSNPRSFESLPKHIVSVPVLGSKEPCDRTIPRTQSQPQGPPHPAHWACPLQTLTHHRRSASALTRDPLHASCCCPTGMAASRRGVRGAPTTHRFPSARTSCVPKTLENRSLGPEHRPENAERTARRRLAPSPLPDVL